MNITFSKELPSFLKIGRVIFVTKEYLLKNKKKYGISESYDNFCHGKSLFDSVGEFNKHKVFALIQTKWDGKRDLDIELDEISNATKILASSQISYMKRYQFKKFGHEFNDQPYCTWSFNFAVLSDKNSHAWHRIFPIEPFNLNELWKQRSKDCFFNELLKICNKQQKTAWEKDIIKAAELIGKSVLAGSIYEAFENNFIALDLLLLRASDKQNASLFERADALLGWFLDGSKFKPVLEALYRKRCGLFHEGSYKEINAIDLINSDVIVLNIFANIIRLRNIIISKSDLIEYSEKIKAYQVLGMKPKRPKILMFWDKDYSKSDIDKLDKHYKYHMN